MSLWSRIANAFRTDRTNREIDEELASHLEDAIANGRDPAEARRALGSALRQRESSRDIKLIPWLDSLRADAVFGFRRPLPIPAPNAFGAITDHAISCAPHPTAETPIPPPPTVQLIFDCFAFLGESPSSKHAKSWPEIGLTL